MTFISQDTIRKHQLTAYVASLCGSSLTEFQVETILRYADTIAPPTVLGSAPPQMVDDLLRFVQQSKKIDAIKTYRQLTGQGLKESKDAIESAMASPVKETV